MVAVLIWENDLLQLILPLEIFLSRELPPKLTFDFDVSLCFHNKKVKLKYILSEGTHQEQYFNSNKVSQ